METYTKKHLEDLGRLQLRRIAKNMGMDATEAGSMKIDDLREAIIDMQEEGEKEDKKESKSKKEKKGSSRKDSKERKSRDTKETKSRRTRRTPKRGKDEESGNSNEIGERLDTIEKKLDELGRVYNENQEELADLVSETATNAHCIKGLLAGLFKELYEEDVIRDDGAGLLEDLEMECESGN